MEPKYELTDNPPPDAFQKMWTLLLKFNEHAVGNANARTLAILLKEPTTDELIGGLWARSLWGSLYIDIMFVPPTLRGNWDRHIAPETGRTGSDQTWVQEHVDRNLRLPSTSVLRTVRL